MRSRKPRSWWLEQYKLWQSSGLNKVSFCKRFDIKLASFYAWSQTFEREVTMVQPDGTPSGFIPVQLVQANQISGVTLTIKDIAIRFDEAQTPDSVIPWIKALSAHLC